MDCEKRRYPRARYDCEILYPFIIKDGQSHCYNQGLYHLHTLDISEAGICLQSNFLISQEDFVSFYLRIAVPGYIDCTEIKHIIICFR